VQLHGTDNTKQLNGTSQTAHQHMLLFNTCCIVAGAKQQCSASQWFYVLVTPDNFPMTTSGPIYVHHDDQE